MKYLRAVISSDTRGVLYKKDFKVQHVFETFVRSFVSTLIKVGLINKGEFYNTLIIPRYGEFSEFAPQITVHGSLRDGQKRGWIDLAFEDSINPDKPIDFFSMDIFIVEQLRSYRSNFELKRINFFWTDIERALAPLGIIRYKEQIQRKLYVRDDDQGDFEHEEMQLSQDDTEALIKILPLDSAIPAFPQKALADFTIQATRRLLRGKLVDDTPELAEKKEETPPSGSGVQILSTSPAEGAEKTGSPGPLAEASKSGVQILITTQALESVQQVARSGSAVEQGGVLVGDVYADIEGSIREYIVAIIGHIPAEEAFANEIELRYTFESWQRQTSLLKKQFPGKRIVGWYHTHLDLVKKTYYTDESRKDMYTTPLFFSQDDTFTHRQFFREKWYVAMVLDPEGNLIFYQWIGDEIKESRRFYVIAPEQVNSEKEE